MTARRILSAGIIITGSLALLWSIVLPFVIVAIGSCGVMVLAGVERWKVCRVMQAQVTYGVACPLCGSVEVHIFEACPVRPEQIS